MLARGLCAFALVVLAACGGSGASSPADVVRPRADVCEPEGWNTAEALTRGLLAEIVEDAEWPDMTIREIQLLAWSARADERPVTVHNAIVWVQATDTDAFESWLLLHLARNPGDEWDLAGTPRALRGQLFDALPTGAEIDAFIEQSTWRWELDGDWRFIAANVCTQTWSDVSGVVPSHAFPTHTPTSL